MQKTPTADYRFAQLLRRFKIESNSGCGAAAKRTEKRLIKLAKSERISITILSEMMGVLARWQIKNSMPKFITTANTTAFKNEMVNWMESVGGGFANAEPAKYFVGVDSLGGSLIAVKITKA